MSQTLTTGNSILGMTNVRLLTTVIKRLQGRAHGLDGIGVLSGEPGLGKTIAAGYAAGTLDAIHISVQTLWTKKTLLENILIELGVLTYDPATHRVTPAISQARMMAALNQALAIANRPLIIDEADRAVERNMIEVIRDIHDGSGASIVLIGMEDLPQKLKKAKQVDSRVLTWVQAEYATSADAVMLAGMYAPGISISPELLEAIRQRNGAVPRRMVNDLALVLETCRAASMQEISLDEWGKAPLAPNQAPRPRPRAQMGEIDYDA